MIRAVLAMLVFVAPAVLPLLATMGVRAESVALLVPLACLLAGVAATLAVMTHVRFVYWLVLAVLVANGISATVLLRRRRTGQPMFEVRRRLSHWAPWLAGLAVAGYGLSELSAQKVDVDALSIWFLHARLLDRGAVSYVSAMHSASYSFSHLEYPLLVPASVNEVWSLAGARSYYLGQVVITLLGVSLIVLVGALIGRVAQGPSRVRLGVIMSVLLVAAAFGVGGRYVANGYADVPVALAAVAGAIALLVLRRSTVMTAVGVICLWIAGLTKPEGLFSAVAIALLVVVRRHFGERERRRVDRRQVFLRGASSFAVLVLPGAAWALFASFAQTAPVDYGPIPPDDLSAWSRAGIACGELLDRIWLVGWLVLIIVVAAWAWRSTRRRWHLASVTWLGGLLVLYLLGLIVRYATGPWNVRWWLATSSDRVTMLPRMLLLTELAIVASFAIAELPSLAVRWRSRHRARDGSSAQHVAGYGSAPNATGLPSSS
jgi:hypothetical protein